MTTTHPEVERLARVTAERDEARDLYTRAEILRSEALSQYEDALRERDDARRDAKRTAAECDAAVADAHRERDAARTRAVAAEETVRTLQIELAEERTGAKFAARQLEVAIAERDNVRTTLANCVAVLGRTRAERDALQARLDAMRRAPTPAEVAP